MPTARHSFGIAVYQNKIYCIGGTTNGPILEVNEVYDPATDAWETKKQMPTARSALNANTVNGKIYLMGGNPGNTTNEAYDPTTDSWTTKTPIPIEAIFSESAVANNKIFLFGGLTNRTATQIYNPTSDTWATGNPIPTGAAEGAAVATTGANAPAKIYVMGGESTYVKNGHIFGNVTNLNQVYNPDTNTWSLGEPLPTERRYFGLGNVNDTVYLLGGFPKTIDFLNTTYQYTPIEFGNTEQEQSTPLPPSVSSNPWFSIEVTTAAVVAISVAVSIIALRKWKQNSKNSLRNKNRD
jgi:N-acetylneuraminic acid mutarotase